MPEFILDSDGVAGDPPRMFRELDGFTQAYIEAIFFTECTTGESMVDWASEETQERIREGQADGSIPADAGYSDLHPKSLESIIKDCAAFQEVAGPLLARAVAECGYGLTGEWNASAQAGHDFWLTRNGHGAGFWDRGLGELGDKLSALCGYGTPFRELNASFGEAADGAESPTGYGFVFVE